MEDTETSSIIDIDQNLFTNLSGHKGFPKLQQTCRVCLCETNESDQKLNTKILLLNNAQEIRSLLEEATGIEIVDLDILPNRICDKCLKTLRAWFRFRSQALRTNETLKKHLNELITSLSNKSLDNTDEMLNEVPKQYLSEAEDFEEEPEAIEFLFNCDSSTMTFTNQVGLEKHREKHIRSPKQNTFKCEACPKSFALRNGLDNHMELCHESLNNIKFQCDVCGKSYNTATGFKVHKSKPCVPVDLIKKCKTRQLDVRIKELKAAADKTIKQTQISCILCKKKFKRYETFEKHFSKHKEDRKCITCHEDFPNIKLLERHMRVHLRAKGYACSICSRSFYSFEPFRAHVYEHGRRKWVYRCNICKKEFFMIKEFDKHMTKHLEAIEDEKKALEKEKQNDVADDVEIKNDNSIEIGNECDSNTSTKDNLNFELTNQMEIDIPSYQKENSEENAPNRPEKPKSEIDLSIYYVIDSNQQIQSIETESLSVDNIKFNHEEQTEISALNDIVELKNPTLKNYSSSEEKPDISDDDDISTLSNTNEQIGEHQSAYTQELLDRCKINCHIPGCQTKCENRAKIWRHFKKEHLTGKKPFKCCMCFKKFEHKRQFQVHIRKYYSFRCPVCLKIQKNSCELKRHVIATHSKERPFKCSKCIKAFASLNNLKGHEMTHNTKKQFVCSICSKDFFSYSGLSSHINTHRVVKELQCSVCSKQFINRYGLKRHKKETSCVRNQKPKSV